MRASRKISWWEPTIGQRERDFIARVLDSGYINDGEITTEFEQAVAKLLGVKHAVAVTSGTAALFLALKALGIGVGDDVIVPDITFIATANAVTLTGATPVLVDINPDDMTIDVDGVRRAITSKTKAIVPVHISGRPVSMRRIVDIARAHNLFVVEDAAQALLSKEGDRYLGTIGDAGCLSFTPNKTITTGQGGMILTNNEALDARLRPLKDQGRRSRGSGGDDIHTSIGYNFKFTNMQAALGLGQLTYLKQRTERMRRNYRIYAEELRGIKGISLFAATVDTGVVPQWTDAVCTRRDELAAYLLKRNIATRNYYLPIHRQAAYRLPDDAFPQSIRMSAQSLWLPSSFNMVDEDIRFVCNAIKDFFAGR